MRKPVYRSPWFLFVVAVAFALVVRGQVLFGVAALFLVFTPLEKLVSLRPQRVFRTGLLTDLTHLLVNGFFVAAGSIVLVVVAAIPFLWLRRIDVEGMLPASASVLLAVAVVFVGQYWAHRLTHEVPFLWRFHAVHHSIEEMDWVAAGRLHPLDQAFTHAVTLFPLVVLGYSGGTFAGVAVGVTLLAIFQHANVRLRFPVLRWIVPTPEWHHWHHALDGDALDKNFGLPVVDKLFGTAFLPKGRRPAAFGTTTPVPQDDYLAQMAFPFASATLSA